MRWFHASRRSIGKTVLCLACLLAASACRKQEGSDANRQPEEEALPSFSQLPNSHLTPGIARDSSAHETGRSFLLKTVRGVIFSIGSDSTGAVAIEAENREVIILTGAKAPLLRNRHNQKMSVTGFWRPAALTTVRDTLEVADFAFIRE